MRTEMLICALFSCWGSPEQSGVAPHIPGRISLNSKRYSHTNNQFVGSTTIFTPHNKLWSYLHFPCVIHGRSVILYLGNSVLF